MQAIKKAVCYIEGNLENEIPVAAVAASAAYSYYHFHRAFEAVVGESIGGYIRSRRLSKAAEDLLDTNKRIIDIALSLQFESHEAFSRAFKRMFHVTPSQYRKNGVDTLLGRKPALDVFSLHHRRNLSLQPEIVMLPAIQLVGMRFPVSIENNHMAQRWDCFSRRLPEIAGAAQPLHRYCFYEAHQACTYDAFAPQTSTTAFIGVETSPATPPPHGMETKLFAGGKYAHFVHVGTTASLLATYRYIWGTWVPYNRVALAERDDVERFTDRFLGVDSVESMADIFLPIL